MHLKADWKLEWKREEVMDGDSGDKGNDKLMCVRLLLLLLHDLCSANFKDRVRGDQMRLINLRDL